MHRARTGIMLGAALAAALVGLAPPALAQTPLTVMLFKGVTGLGLYAAVDKGFFAKRGLSVDVKFAPNSTEQRKGLIEGRYQIIHSAADNAVAMVELAKADAIILTGGDNGGNHLVVRPEIGGYADLRGKTVAVDAPNTAYALVLYQMLKLNGVNKGEYTVSPQGGSGKRLAAMKANKAVAGILNMPFTLFAAQAGMKDLGSAVKTIGPYQGGVVMTMRPWAKANADTVVKYIQAYVEGLRWATNPANKAEALAVLERHLGIKPEIALAGYQHAVDPVDGLAKDAKFDMDGFKNVLKLRAELEGQWGGKPPAPDKYIDLSYYDRALKGL